MKWGSMKYHNKLNNLAYAISQFALDYCPQGPAVIGISEIENRGVIEDLIKTGPLANRNYGIVHYDSPDRRGVDVGLIYNADLFTVESRQKCSSGLSCRYIYENTRPACGYRNTGGRTYALYCKPLAFTSRWREKFSP